MPSLARVWLAYFFTTKFQQIFSFYFDYTVVVYGSISFVNVSFSFIQTWTPPTPPRDGDVEYAVDYMTQFLYEKETIPENHLPPTHYLKYI